MKKLYLTPAARADLLDISDYIESDRATAAKRVRTRIREAMHKLAERPQIGHLREDLADEPLRFGTVYSFLIIYRTTPKQVEILRILHGARDIRNLLKREVTSHSLPQQRLHQRLNVQSVDAAIAIQIRPRPPLAVHWLTHGRAIAHVDIVGDAVVIVIANITNDKVEFRPTFRYYQFCVSRSSGVLRFSTSIKGLPMTSIIESRSSFALLSTVFIVLTAAVPAVAQQPNDSCEDAIDIVDGEYEGSNLFTAGEGFSICGSSSGQPDVWYRFVAPFDGLLIARTCQAATYDSVLGIWNGCPANDGVELACSDEGCHPLLEPHRSSVGASITATQQYWIRVTGYEGDQGTFTLSVLSTPTSTPTGPDVVLSDLTDVANFPAQNGVRAYITDTHTCNIGDTNLAWGDTTPLMTWNAYRLAGGRLEQIGLSWVKHGFAANESGGCGPACQGDPGPGLAPGCRDVYGSEFNSAQGPLGPRSEVDAFTGFYPGPSGECEPGDSICKRLQINEADLDPGLYPDALYFMEIVYVAQDDAAAGNALNNVSYNRVSLGENFTLVPDGPITVGKPALQAWREHGFGINTPDPDVSLDVIDVPGEGRFHIAAKARDLGQGNWRFEYAVFNLNSHRSGRSFNVFVPEGVAVTNIGFHDVSYHSGEPFDGTDWASVVDFNGVTWSCPQTFAQNPNANALRYGTQYNFWFDANAAPIGGTGLLGLFRPGDNDVLGFGIVTPGTPSSSCPSLGNMNGDAARDGLDIQHFIDCALSGFSPGADCACGDMDNSGFHDETDTFLFAEALLAN